MKNRGKNNQLGNNVFEYHTPGFPCRNLKNKPIFEWLQDFDFNEMVEIASWLEEDSIGTWIVPPIPLLAEFRRFPLPALDLVFRTLRYLWKTLPQPGRVIWALENSENRGLDDFEVDAIFSKWLVVRDLIQIRRGTQNSKLIVSGILREERIGLSFHLSNLTFKNSKTISRCLSILESSPYPIAAIYLNNPDARALNQNLKLVFLKKKVRRLLKDESISLAFSVSSERTTDGFEKLDEELRPVRELARSPQIPRLIRFEGMNGLNSSVRLMEVLRQSGIGYDSSMVSKGFDEENPNANLIFEGPYLRAGAYQPQLFDIRTPSGTNDSNGVIELVVNPLPRPENEMKINEIWERRLGRPIEEYAQLLDFQRMEKYFQAFEQSLDLQQTYQKYRIYNWPSGDPAHRVTFFDGGDLDDPLAVEKTAEQFEQFNTISGHRWEIVGQSELLEVASKEARNRVEGKNPDELAHQREGHQYLKNISPGDPLRKDVEDFIEFLPESLGTTLELGSGNGQLAGHVNSRADFYLCLDLHVGMALNGPGVRKEFQVIADVQVLPLQDQTFMTVVANNILEHLSNPLQCLQEVWRILKPGGKIYSLIPLDALNPKYQIPTHYWVTDMQGIVNLYQMANFSICRQEAINLYQLGIAGCFPSCNGWVAKVEVEKPLSSGM